MPEIRNLTRNGETFYPLTIVEAVSDPNSEYIGQYVENPEWIRVIADSGGKILAGIKSDGNIEWSLGVPKPVKDYINGKIEELNLDDYEDIATFLGSLIKGDKTLQQLLSEKVDKVDGESLIDEDVSQSIYYEENPEFFKVELDAEGHIIKAIKNDGIEYFSAGIETSLVSIDDIEIYSINYPEFLGVFLDNENRILMGFQKDGNVYYGVGVPRQIKDYIDVEIAKKLGFFQEIDNSNFVEACTDDKDKLLEATTKSGKKIFFGDVEIQNKLSAGKISSNKILLGEEELSPASTIEVNTIIDDPIGRLEIKLDKKQNIISYRDEKGSLHENVGIETKEIKLSQTGLDALAKDLHVNWSDYISNDGENPLHLDIPKCARINLLTNFDLTKLSKAGYSMYSKEGVNYDIPIETEFWDMQGNYFKKKAFISGQGDSTMTFDKKNIAIDLFDSEWGGDAFSIKFGDWIAQDSFHLKAYDYEPFVGVGAWSYKLFDQMATIYDPESDRIWKKALWDTTANIPTQASGSDLEESSEYNDTGAKCFPDGFPVVIYQNDAFWGVFSMQLKKHRDNYHLSGSKPNHVFLDGKIGEGSLDANGDPDAIRWDLWEIRNPKNLVYTAFSIYSSVTTYKTGDVVTDDDRTKIYRSLQDDNTGNPLTFPYWKDCGDYTYKYDADVTQAEIAGNHDGSSSYNNWTAGTYNVGDLRKHIIDGKSHIFMNVVAGNNKEPAIVYNAQKDEWYNTDKSPDFKNKSKCGWLNITNTVKVKENIFAFTTIMTKIDAKETVYLADPTTENLAAMKAEFETYFDVQNLIDYIIVTDVIRDDDAFWKNWLWTTYDGVKWWCNLYDCNISFGYGGAGTGGLYRNPAPYLHTYVNNNNIINIPEHLCTNVSRTDKRSDFMLRYIIDYYADELKQTWIKLRESKIVDENNIYNIAKNWIDAIGLDAYALENKKWGYVKHIDNMTRIKKWIYTSVCNLDPVYGCFDGWYADFISFRSTTPGEISCFDMKISHILTYDPTCYIQGHITRHEHTAVVEGEETVVSTYTITGGEETDKDSSKTYLSVSEAIDIAKTQLVNVPSENIFYIEARTKDQVYYKK